MKKRWKKIKTWFSGNHPPIKEELNMEELAYEQALRQRELMEEQMVAQAYAETYREEMEERRTNWREAMHEGFPRDAEERVGWTPQAHWGREGEEIPSSPSYFNTSMLERENVSIHDMLEERDRDLESRRERWDRRRVEHEERIRNIEDTTRRMLEDDDYLTQPIEYPLRQPNHPEIEETRSAVWEIKREMIDITEGVFNTKTNKCKYYSFCGEKTEEVHPDYVNEWICKKCLEVRNKYEVH